MKNANKLEKDILENLNIILDDTQEYISLDNYKSFFNEQKIPIKDITLIFGHNSSGKSSIIESLTTLKETYSKSNITSFATRGEYKLSSFKESITDGNLNKILKISSQWLFLATSSSLLNNKPYPYCDSAKISKNFKWDKNSVKLKSIELYPSISKDFVNINENNENNLICRFLFRKAKKKDFNISNDQVLYQSDPELKNSDIAEIELSSVNYNHPYWDDLFNLILDNNFYKKFIFSLIESLNPRQRSPYSSMLGIESLRLSNENLGRRLREYYDGFTKEQVDYYEYFIKKFNIDVPLVKQTRGFLNNSEQKIKDYKSLSSFDELFKIKKTRRFYYPEKLNFRGSNTKIRKILNLIKNGKDIKKYLLKDFVENSFYIFKGIDTVFKRSYSIIGDISFFRTEFITESKVDLTEENFDLYKKIINFKHPQLSLSRMLLKEKDFCSQIVPLGVNRPDPLSVYEYSGTQTETIGSSAQHMPDILYRMPAQIKNKLNYWLNEIGLKYSVDLKKTLSTGLFQIQVKDKSRSGNKEGVVNYKDAGTGIHSILPVILNTILLNNKILTFQEPERSLHPKNQIRMADMFVEISNSENSKNKFIIETHSEYLVYRFMKLVRDQKISNTRLSFNYVYKTDDGSKIVNLRMDENGKFLDKWPQGFFTERFEVFKK